MPGRSCACGRRVPSPPVETLVTVNRTRGRPVVKRPERCRRGRRRCRRAARPARDGGPATAAPIHHPPGGCRHTHQPRPSMGQLESSNPSTGEPSDGGDDHARPGPGRGRRRGRGSRSGAALAADRARYMRRPATWSSPTWRRVASLPRASKGKLITESYVMEVTPTHRRAAPVRRRRAEILADELIRDPQASSRPSASLFSYEPLGVDGVPPRGTTRGRSCRRAAPALSRNGVGLKPVEPHAAARRVNPAGLRRCGLPRGPRAERARCRRDRPGARDASTVKIFVTGSVEAGRRSGSSAPSA